MTNGDDDSGTDGTRGISESAREAISQIAETQGADPDEVAAAYRENLAAFEDKDVSDPERRALRKTNVAMKAGPSGPDKRELVGMVLGASDPIDTTESRVRRAVEYVEKHGVGQAKARGLLKRPRDGPVPDGYATIEADGEEYAVMDNNDGSPNNGEPLPAEDWIRYAYGVAWPDPEAGDGGASGGPELFSGVLNGGDGGDCPPLPPLFEPCAFEAAITDGDDSINNARARFSGPEPFDAGRDVPVPDDARRVLEEAVGVTELPDATAERFGRNDVVVVHGSVTYMELSPPDGNSRRLTITEPFEWDRDLRVTVWLPDHHEVDYGQSSDVYVVGQVSPASSPEYSDSVEAVGVWVDPEYVEDRGHIESMAGGGGDAGDDGGAHQDPDPEPDPEPGAEPGDDGGMLGSGGADEAGAATDGGDPDAAGGDAGVEDEEWEW